VSATGAAQRKGQNALAWAQTVYSKQKAGTFRLNQCLKEMSLRNKEKNRLAKAVLASKPLGLKRQLRLTSEAAKLSSTVRMYPGVTTDPTKLIDEKLGFRRAVVAIIERNPVQLYNAIEEVHDFEMELAVSILSQAWRADDRDNLIGRKNGMVWPALQGVECGRERFNNTPFYETRSTVLVALAVKHDDPRMLDVMDKWTRTVEVPLELFVEEDAPKCLAHAIKRLKNDFQRVEDVRSFMEGYNQQQQQPPPPTKPIQQPPTSKRLSPPRPYGGESEHMRAYRAREAAESAARAEAERDARAKIEADRKERRVADSNPIMLNNGVNHPPQKTKNLVDCPLDAHARAKHVAQKAAAVEEVFVHASKLKLAEEVRVAAAEAKLSLIRIGREIGGGF